MSTSAPLPRDFLWGCATSAFQVEGGATLDGRGASIWDRFCALPGAILDGSDAATACDHYHRFRADFDLLEQLAVAAYRFSVSWPRILPDGTGTPNRDGLGFYDRLVDDLLARGIEPWLTLYHWDLPQALQDRGGWCNRDIIDWFADYAALVMRHLADRVGHCMLLNEPNMTSLRGHAEGVFPPGLKDAPSFFASLHHQNLAQGRALRALHAAHRSLRCGTALLLGPVAADTPSASDLEAARILDAVWNRAFLDPLLRGRYPEALLDALGPFMRSGDLDQIAAPIDFLGVNYYVRYCAAADPTAALGVRFARRDGGAALSPFGSAAFPEGLFAVLEELRTSYGNPRVYITENGYRGVDERCDASGRIRDPARIEYIEAHLRAIARAIASGANVGGYFHWSLLDNFEWTHGYRARFGLVEVDFVTQARTPKDSFHWLRQRILQTRLAGAIGY